MVWKRPTVNTQFHIDWDWWVTSEQNYRLYLHDQLCEECRHRFPSPFDVEEVDWVDPNTAEVTRTDALMMCLRTQCAQDPDYINATTPLAAAVFRVFLINHNKPLSPNELYELLPWRPANTILRVIGSRRAHYGIRPVG